MADLGLVVADLVVGLMLGCVFAVIAHGLNVIWGVTKVVNVAHGEFIMLGAYGAYYLNVYLGFNPVLSRNPSPSSTEAVEKEDPGPGRA